MRMKKAIYKSRAWKIYINLKVTGIKNLTVKQNNVVLKDNAKLQYMKDLCIYHWQLGVGS